MASFPDAIVSISNPISTSKLNSPSHAAQHTTINAEVIAIETILGTNPEGSDTTVKDRLVAIEAEKFDVANVSTSTSLGTSNTLVPSQNAVKEYVDAHTSTGSVSITVVPFTSSDLATGVLTISGEKTVLCVRDNSDEVIIPDSIIWTASNTKVSVLSYGTISGTWEVAHL